MDWQEYETEVKKLTDLWGVPRVGRGMARLDIKVAMAVVNAGGSRSSDGSFGFGVDVENVRVPSQLDGIITDRDALDIVSDLTEKQVASAFRNAARSNKDAFSNASFLYFFDGNELTASFSMRHSQKWNSVVGMFGNDLGSVVGHLSSRRSTNEPSKSAVSLLRRVQKSSDKVSILLKSLESSLIAVRREMERVISGLISDVDGEAKAWLKAAKDFNMVDKNLKLSSAIARRVANRALNQGFA